ncbi:MAG: ankyrin repeat domain-containing protein [Gammaproteobacteria bacterium]
MGKDPPKKNLPTVIPPASVSLSRAKTLIRLTNEILAERKPPDPELLFYATERGDVAEVKRLLAAGANPNAMDDHGRTALQTTALCGHAEVTEVLLSAGANPNAANNDGVTALIAATMVLYGHAEVAKILLSAGANPNAADKDGWTALMFAATGRKTAIVKILLSTGANPNVADANGKTALALARAKERWIPEIIRILEEAGAKE